MGTPTSHQYWAISNLGPATTTFTPSPACSTSRYTEILSPSGSVTFFYGDGNCKSVYYDGCIPNGKAYDKTIADTPSHDLATINVIWQSPGLYCPSGWTTAGSVVGVADTKNGTSQSGVFTATTQFRAYAVAPSAVLYAQVSALAPSETLAWCCPSGYEANVGGNCYSYMGPVSSYSFSEVCYRFASDSPILSFVPVTDPIAKSIASDYTVYARQPVVALVHKDSDLPASAEAKSTGGASVSLSSSGGSASPSKKSVARRVLPRLTGVVSVSLVAALVGIPWM